MSFDIPILSSIVAYSLCSGSLLLVNKMVLAQIPSSPLVTAAQCLFCVLAIALCHLVFKAPKLDVMTQPVLKAYGLYAILFVLAIYSNMKSLESSNVDTVIVFRSTVPLIVSIKANEDGSPSPAMKTACIQIGDKVSKIAGDDVLGKPHELIIALIKASKRPVIVHFLGEPKKKTMDEISDIPLPSSPIVPEMSFKSFAGSSDDLITSPLSQPPPSSSDAAASVGVL